MSRKRLKKQIFFLSTSSGILGFDTTCDLSAVLGILPSADVFIPDVQDFSSKVRNDVRNEWAHCNFVNWDAPKFTSCFERMKEVLRSLKLSPDDENELQVWENKGMLSNFIIWHQNSARSDWLMTHNDRARYSCNDRCFFIIFLFLIIDVKKAI
jgi:hypothetical protein